MREFQVGDRVRVRAIPSTASCAGETGELASVAQKTTSDAPLYLVRLDSKPDTCAAFLPDELELEAE